MIIHVQFGAVSIAAISANVYNLDRCSLFIFEVFCHNGVDKMRTEAISIIWMDAQIGFAFDLLIQHSK